MTDFDKLERLVRIRDSGGLSEDEFQAEKMKLLAPRQSVSIDAPSPTRRKLWLGVAGVAAALVVLFAVLVTFSRSQPTALENPVDDQLSQSPPRSQEADSASDTMPATTIKSTLSKGSYAWAISIFRIGENPSYIESILGPSKQKGDNYLSYDIQGCSVNYLTNSFKVTGIQMAVTDECKPDVNNRVITPQTTFVSIYRDSGFLQTECLMLCGNKADPTIEYVVPGSHADGFIGVAYSTYDGDDGVTVWGDEIVKDKGVTDTFSVPEGGFLCPPKPSQSVVAAMANAKVESVTLGVDVEKCAKW